MTNEKTYSTVLTEAASYFQSMGTNIVGEGYKEIASNPTLFENYVQALTEGCSADSKAVIAQLMENTNANILTESSVSGIAPIASLSMPVIRRLWPKFALKEAIKTEVAKTPRFIVSYTKPYMEKKDSNGQFTKVYLPQGLKDGETADNLTAAGKKEFVEATVASTVVGQVATLTFGKEIDRDTFVEVYLPGNPSATPPTSDKLLGRAQIDINNSVILPVAVDASTTAQVIVKVDLKAGTGIAIATAAGLKIVVKAGINTQWNEDAYSIGFDIERLDIQIPTGQHITAPLAIEALNDMQAMYQIDGTKEATDLMTQVFSQKLDLDILDFLELSYANQPSAVSYNNAGAASKTAVFDAKPAAGFAGSPKAWREEIKPIIDYVAQTIKNETYFQAGIFTIIANPLDANLISNIDWQFKGASGALSDGVDVDYSIGTYVGPGNVYKVISSVNVKQGAMYIVFTPSSDKQMTYKYYPYTFSVEMGYRDPNRPMVPALMMTKRHTISEFISAIGCIIINNNDIRSADYGADKAGYMNYYNFAVATDEV